MPNILKNRTIFTQDNLEVLREINSQAVDLIYLDPPFNTNRHYTASTGSSAAGASFSDIFKQEDVKVAWLGLIAKQHPHLASYLHGIDKVGHTSNKAYLCYMGVRLIEMHRILKDTGSLYLHCDPTMSHYLKVLLDAVFGAENFRNEIIWHHPKIGVAKHQFTSNTDTIFLYSKSKHSVFNVIRGSEPNTLYERWKRKLKDGILYYKEAKNIHDSPAQSKIRVLQKKLNRPLCDEDVVVDFNEEENHKVVDNMWYFSFLKGNSKESTGYPTQKPIKLLERIIQASSKVGDMVLDPFCGCATACVAAEKLGRQWVGVDVSLLAFELVKIRLDKEVDVVGEGTTKLALDDKKIHHVQADKTLPSRIDREIKDMLYGQQDGVCKHCNLRFEYRHLDVVPLVPPIASQAKDSADQTGNWQLLCSHCRTKKL